MTDLLKATTSPPSTTVEGSSEAEEARVGSLDHVDGVRGALSVIETTAEVADTALEMPVRPPTIELLIGHIYCIYILTLPCLLSNKSH